MENKVEQMLSLYEYLGRPVGSEQGKKIYADAKQGFIKCGNKDVSNPKFTGKVLTYPKSWLDDYFKNPIETQVNTNISDDLPF